MTLREPPDSRVTELIPVVTYAVKRRVDDGDPDYWDYATQLELAVLAADQDGVAAVLPDVLAAVREPWEPETTCRNLRLIREAREKRGEVQAWMLEVENELSG